MLTFEKILVIVTVIIVTFAGNIFAIREGSTCSFPGGKIGVCTKLPECQLIDNGLKANTISAKNIVHCSFIGNTIVICCPDRVPTNIMKPTRKYPHSQGGIVFLDSDYDDDNFNILVRGSTRKAVRECENYKANLGPRIDFHIIDGEPTKPGEFPHMAGLGYREFDTDEYTWDCGGSLISNRFILTAAHCVDNAKRQPKLIRLGKTTVRNNDDGAEAVDVQIKKISIHPEYRSFAKYNDIALIEMTKPVKFNNEVGPACLYTNKDDLSDSEILVAIGWGVNDVNKRTNSNFLLKANLTSNPLSNCNQSYFDYGATRQFPAGLDSGQMCAYDKSFNKDSCQGDSGSPLQLLDDALHLSTIVGLTSFGVVGCASEIPSVYTRVAFYLDWIESIIWP